MKRPILVRSLPTVLVLWMWFIVVLACQYPLRMVAGTQDLSLRSPDRTIEVTVSLHGALSYSVSIDGHTTIYPSGLGLLLTNGRTLGANAALIKAQHSSSNTVWDNRWGKRRRVRDHYNQIRLILREQSNGYTFEVFLRAYNDGVAFRYSVPSQPELETLLVQQEQSQFTFPTDLPCYAGKQENGFSGAQEWEFKPSHLSNIKPESIIGLPLLIQTPSAWVALLESDLRDWSGLWLGAASNSTAADRIVLQSKLAPRKDGQGLVKVQTPHVSPWRVLLIARRPGQLIESDLVLNLSTPCQLADTSWIRPGMMAWDHWWSGDVQMDTSTIKEYIELASQMGWPYQLIDWQWYGPFNQTNSDITKVNPALDMEEVRKFAEEKHVRLWLWLYHTDVERNNICPEAFALYEKWGIAGVKIDFMDRDDQEMVNWYEKITKAAADHHLMVNFHGAFKTSGFNRTYPNQVTREGILGNEYNRWSERVTPEHKLTLPFTRFLAGPADFTPGGFVNRQPGQFKADGKCAQVQGTRAAELALFVAYDSPLCCVCDNPSHYYDQPGAGFLKLVPTVWDDTSVLDAEVGKRLVIARRSGQTWFVAGMTDRTACSETINLGFLGRGNWRLRLWTDAPDSATNAEHLITEERRVKSSDQINVQLAPAGGFVGWLRPD